MEKGIEKSSSHRIIIKKEGTRDVGVGGEQEATEYEKEFTIGSKRKHKEKSITESFGAVTKSKKQWASKNKL